MTVENGRDPKPIIDMTMAEKTAAMDIDPFAYYERAYAEERPRAEEQVKRRLQRLRELGHQGLQDAEL